MTGEVIVFGSGACPADPASNARNARPNALQWSELRAVLSQPRRMALLAYLAVATPRGFHRRDHVLALFWSEHDLEGARSSLNRAIYFLRRELGDGIIVSRGADELGLDFRAFWCDAAAFDDALDRNGLEPRSSCTAAISCRGSLHREQRASSDGSRAHARVCVSAPQEPSWTAAAESESRGELCSPRSLRGGV